MVEPRPLPPLAHSSSAVWPWSACSRVTPQQRPDLHPAGRKGDKKVPLLRSWPGTLILLTSFWQKFTHLITSLCVGDCKVVFAGEPCASKSLCSVFINEEGKDGF